MLVDAIRGVIVVPRQVILPTELVIRESCGGLAATRAEV
jgi:DNA-binding LacI/PurR family transcriptional regulator